VTGAEIVDLEGENNGRRHNDGRDGGDSDTRHRAALPLPRVDREIASGEPGSEVTRAFGGETEKSDSEFGASG